MIAATDIFSEFNANTLILVVAVVGYVVKTVGEGRGWFKSAANLRVENTDLLRRNDELEATTRRHEETIRAQGEQIIRLEEQVRALEKLDQSAVLQALKDHEQGAVGRAEETHRLLGESTTQLVRIATVLETPVLPPPTTETVTAITTTTKETT